jgi:hypothetical protein
VEEKPSDQLELSAGWGGIGRGVIGTLGVSFNNFSMRNILNKEAWNPLPQGDGQRLSLRAQTNGRLFQSYNASFTEPWLGGKKPNSFSVAGFYTLLTNGLDRENSNYGAFGIGGVTLSLGTRLKWPDDNFVSSTAINIQNLALNNWQGGVFPDRRRTNRYGRRLQQLLYYPNHHPLNYEQPTVPTRRFSLQLVGAAYSTLFTFLRQAICRSAGPGNGIAG